METLQQQLMQSLSEYFVPKFAPGGLVIDGGDLEAIERYDVEGMAPGVVKRHTNAPDMIVHLPQKGSLYLIDLESGYGPITAERRERLDDKHSTSGVHLIFVSVVSTRAGLAAFADTIAWGTIVWAADAPDHLIHFGGHGLQCYKTE